MPGRPGRKIGSEGRTLGHADRNAHSGECTRSPTKGNRIQGSESHTRFGQQFIHHRQYQLTVHARLYLIALDDFPVDQQSGRTGLGSGFYGKYLHGGRLYPSWY